MEVSLSPTAAGAYDEKRPMIVQEIKDEHGNDQYCRQAPSTVGFPGLKYNHHRNRFLTRVASIDEAVQKVDPTSRRARLLFQTQFATLAGHQGERRVCDTMRGEYH